MPGTNTNTDTESERIESIINNWGISDDIAEEIVLNDQEDELDQTMFITSDGMVTPAADEEELKELLMIHLNEIGGLYQIEYIFIDGKEIKGVHVLLIFDKMPPVSTEPNPDRDIPPANIPPEPNILAAGDRHAPFSGMPYDDEFYDGIY